MITDRGTYTITEIQNGYWGRLKSGAGWISVHEAYCTYKGAASSDSGGSVEKLLEIFWFRWTFPICISVKVLERITEPMVSVRKESTPSSRLKPVLVLMLDGVS